MTRKKTFKSKERKFFEKHKGLALRIAVPAAILSLVLALIPSNDFTPTTAKELAQTSVKVLNKAMTGGGSGVILKSSDDESLILTNKHVCRVVAKGGFIEKENGAVYLIHQYMVSQEHDICMVKVRDNLGVNTTVAQSGPGKYTNAYISGHPSLLPHVVSYSHFSGRMTINVLLGYRECTPEEEKKYFECAFGRMPLVKAFDSQLVTGTIMPGSSGSAIFDENGHIAGLVFAGRGRGLSYAFAVPRQYITYFLEIEAPLLEWRTANKENETVSEDFEYTDLFLLDVPVVISY